MDKLKVGDKLYRCEEEYNSTVPNLGEATITKISDTRIYLRASGKDGNSYNSAGSAFGYRSFIAYRDEKYGNLRTPKEAYEDFITRMKKRIDDREEQIEDAKKMIINATKAINS